jgi:hypothetical protein
LFRHVSERLKAPPPAPLDGEAEEADDDTDDAADADDDNTADDTTNDK